MKIDNSAAETWAFCPRKYQEVHVNGFQRADNSDARGFGGRVHELLAEHILPQGLGFKTDVPEHIASEAQELFEAYVAHYPTEDWTVLDVEQYFEVPLPGTTHVYHGKMDGVVRDNSSGRLVLLEHKTEARGSKGHLPEVWAAKPQVSLYLWAGEQIYHEPFDSICLDVLTRRSPAGRIPPTFRRDTLQRSAEAQARAVRNITWIANQIEALNVELRDGIWPSFDSNCNKGGWKCDFYSAHVVAETQVAALDEFVRQRNFTRADDYLSHGPEPGHGLIQIEPTPVSDLPSPEGPDNVEGRP